MALSKKTCKIYLAQKQDEKTNIWQNRLSIFENVNGKNKEVLFVKDASPKEFILKLKSKFINHHLKHYSIIRRNERYSMTFKNFFKNSENMRQVPNDLFKEVSFLLAEVRSKVITQNSEQTVLT